MRRLWMTTAWTSSHSWPIQCTICETCRGNRFLPSCRSVTWTIAVSQCPWKIHSVVFPRRLQDCRMRPFRQRRTFRGEELINSCKRVCNTGGFCWSDEHYEKECNNQRFVEKSLTSRSILRMRLCKLFPIFPRCLSHSEHPISQPSCSS